MFLFLCKHTFGTCRTRRWWAESTYPRDSSWLQSHTQRSVPGQTLSSQWQVGSHDVRGWTAISECTVSKHYGCETARHAWHGPLVRVSLCIHIPSHLGAHPSRSLFQRSPSCPPVTRPTLQSTCTAHAPALHIDPHTNRVLALATRTSCLGKIAALGGRRWNQDGGRGIVWGGFTKRPQE